MIQFVKPELNVPLLFWEIHILYINCKYKITKKIYHVMYVKHLSNLVD